MTLLKKLLLSSIMIGGASASSIALADDFGCKAVLCFAGGKGLSECASTTSEVKKRLAKGKSFPSCSFVGPSGQQDDLVKQSNRFTRHIGRNNNICPDGSKTGWYRDGTFKCNAITVTFKGANPNGGDLIQEINWY